MRSADTRLARSASERSHVRRSGLVEHSVDATARFGLEVQRKIARVLQDDVAVCIEIKALAVMQRRCIDPLQALLHSLVVSQVEIAVRLSVPAARSSGAPVARVAYAVAVDIGL